MEKWSVTICPRCFSRAKVKKLKGASVLSARCDSCEYEYVMANSDVLYKLLRADGDGKEVGHERRP